MKFLALIGDGMADFPLPELDGRTPLEVAFTPSMDEVAARGLTGLSFPIPEGLPPGSDIGNLSLFGYNPHETYTGRAPLEAANQGLTLRPDQVAFRCNLVTLHDGVMQDFTAGHISSEEGAALIASLKSGLSSFPVFFSAGVSYRHISIITAKTASVEELVAISCTPPHDITGREYASNLPSGHGAQVVLDLMEASQSILAGHPVNEARIAAGKLPANSIWLWGQGRAPSLTPYKNRFNIGGAVISAVDLVKGIGLCAGLEAIKIPGATGYLDTNYKGKVAAALEALRLHDFVYLHVEAPDETSHEGKLNLKIKAIEDFDAQVVAPCLDHMRNRKDFRLLVSPDHVTSLHTKTHALGAVPFAACGGGIASGPVKYYSEKAAGDSGIVITDGYKLVPHLLTSPTVEAAGLARL